MGAPHSELLPLGHESVALDKLLSLPERKQLADAGAGLLLWDEDEDEEKQRGEGGRRGEWECLMAPRRRSEGDRQRREGTQWDRRTGAVGGGRRGGGLHTLPTAPSSAPPTVALSLASSHTPR